MFWKGVFPISDTEKKATIRDIATACGVSIATVSRVLNHIPGRSSAETEAKIWNAVKELGYYPNPIARSLINRQSKLIAVLVPDIHYYFFQDFFVGLEQYLNKYEYRVILCNIQENSKLEAQYIQELCNGLVDGIVISTLNRQENNDPILKLHRKGFPVVLLERYGKDLKNICGLHVDNYGSGRKAVEYLFHRGHRRIAFIKGYSDAYNAQIRFKGYLDGLKEADIPYDASLVAEGDYGFDSGTTAMEELLKRGGFTAVVCSNDLMTIGAAKAIARQGLGVPGDMSIVGVDCTVLTRTREPSITALDFCARKMGIKAGDLLMQMIRGGETIPETFEQESELVEGDSVRDIRDDPAQRIFQQTGFPFGGMPR